MKEPYARVVGRIFVKGSGAGIADLEVVLMDVDLPDAAKRASRENMETFYHEVFSRFWVDYPVDRLGSVLTDAKGRFLLPYDPEDFQLKDAEKRPDLILLVMAPDEAVDPSRPFGKIPRERILHFSWVPRGDAGRIESYTIAVDPARLEAFGVSYRGSKPSPLAHADQLERSIGQAKDSRSRRIALVSGEVAQKAPAMAAFAAARSVAWRWLMPLRVSVGSGTVFKAPGEAAEAAQRRAAGEGLARISLLPAQARFRFTPAELARLGVAPASVTESTPVPVSFCDALTLKGFGRELVRVRSLLEEVKRRRQAEAALRPSEAADDPGTITPPLLPDPGAATHFIQERVLGQLLDLPGIAAGRPQSAISELEKVKQAVNKLELSGGPANVTAFHDFHTLQIAFKDVWTSAFDDRLKDQVLELYKETVKLHEEYGLEVPDMASIQDVNELRAFMSGIRGLGEYAEVLPVDPDVQECYPQMDVSLWNRLSDDGRAVLRTTADNFLRPWDSGNDIDPPIHEWTTQEYLDSQYERVMKYHLTTPLARVEKLVLDISRRLSEPYGFHYFAPGTVNYGVLLTYRQEWQPETYQVGRLVGTIPLAPGEKRTFKITQSVKKSRAEKAIEKSLMERSSEGKFSSRAEVEVMAKVSSSTNFRMTAQGTFNIGVGSITSTTEFGHNQQQESTSNKKAFNEAVRQAAEKVRKEREVHIEDSRESHMTSEATHEISNPNNELTVTYLLYELERRYTVSTRLHAVTPVILVAMDIPAPHEITEAWILENAWILRRCLLDDQFQMAIDFIEDGLVADSLQLEVHEANWKTQKKLVADLESTLDELRRIREQRRTSLVRLTEAKDRAEAGESDVDDVAKAIFSGGMSLLFGGEPAPDRSALLEAQRKAIEQMLEYTEEQFQEAQERLSRTREALQIATDAYAKAMREKVRKEVQVKQLQLHIRQNILHYMHAKYDYMHPDELMLSLYHKEVPFLSSATRPCTLRRATSAEREAGIPGVVRDGDFFIVECAAPTPPDPAAPLPMRPLHEIAEFRPLGFKGNYLILPLKECSHLTDFMIQGFVDDFLGVRDPALADGLGSKELLDYAAALVNDPAATLTDAEKDALRAMILRKLAQAGDDMETLVLPTGQVYMEALKGEQSLLEDFKLAHRGLDVLAAQEDVRKKRLDNLARAQRQTQDPPQLDHYDPEKVVLIKGDTGRLTVPGEG